MTKRLITVTTVLALLFGVFIFVNSGKDKATETFSNAILKQGSSGNDVYELQGRLTYLGYFDGEIDGVFGSKTRNAVTWFQWKFGLKADGVVGAETKLKLWEATKEWRPSSNTSAPSDSGTATGNKKPSGNTSSSLPQSNRLNLTENDIRIMSNAVYGEARGEPYEGQVAVAAVILNRLKSPSFPNSINGVIFQTGAFTAVADGQIWLTPNEKARQAVMDAINGVDPTDGCLYYFNPVTATSKWIWTRPQYKTIGKHIFCM